MAMVRVLFLHLLPPRVRWLGNVMIMMMMTSLSAVDLYRLTLTKGINFGLEMIEEKLTHSPAAIAFCESNRRGSPLL